MIIIPHPELLSDLVLVQSDVGQAQQLLGSIITHSAELSITYVIKPIDNVWHMYGTESIQRRGWVLPGKPILSLVAPAREQAGADWQGSHKHSTEREQERRAKEEDRGPGPGPGLRPIRESCSHCPTAPLPNAVLPVPGLPSPLGRVDLLGLEVRSTGPPIHQSTNQPTLPPAHTHSSGLGTSASSWLSVPVCCISLWTASCQRCRRFTGGSRLLDWMGWALCCGSIERSAKSLAVSRQSQRRSGQKIPWPRAVPSKARAKTWAAGLVPAARQAATRLGPRSLPTNSLSQRSSGSGHPGAVARAVAAFPSSDDPEDQSASNDDCVAQKKRRHTVQYGVHRTLSPSLSLPFHSPLA